jgi:hypothetical protein
VSICTALASPTALKAQDKGGMARPVEVDGTRRRSSLSTHGNRCGSQLNVVLLIVQHSLSIGLHGDDPGGPGYLKLEVSVARDGHEPDITWPP